MTWNAAPRWPSHRRQLALRVSKDGNQAYGGNQTSRIIATLFSRYLIAIIYNIQSNKLVLIS